ncbi:serine/threonine-protein kinase [Streptomyces sp. NPDC093600]|uniref:serine/threonine-protein kinase n=1 Tax=Streptomyces sp. NPDC093600 TaxID=3366047 RepID=UPI003826FDF7
MTVIAGRYRLLDILGEGGMGTVWRARDEALGREVAVKEVRAPVGTPAGEEGRLYARLEREAWAAARISHRNVVTVYDVATDGGRPWIVMELIRGLTLSEVLDAEGPMPPRRAASIGAEVLAALRAAHGAGVLHRDVKPVNVLLRNDGRVVLTDFGIATVEGASTLTVPGELVGSPEFLAPERALGDTPGPASDLWSLGVLLYASVEGNSPFRQDTPLSTLRAVVDEELPPPRRAGPLAPVIEGLLRKEPDERLTAEEAERQLRLVGAGRAPEPGTLRAEPYGPVVRADTSDMPPPLPFLSSTAPLSRSPATGAGTSSGRGRRSGRGGPLLAVAIALLLAAIALAYWLLRNEDRIGATGKGGGPTSSAPGASSPPASTTSAPSSGSPSATPTTTATTSPPATTTTTATATTTVTATRTNTATGTTAPPSPSVLVYVTAVRGGYSGPCPPPAAKAPAFSATLMVGRTPASVEYRWVTESGETSAGGWRTLEFAAGGPERRRVDHTELTYRAGDTRRDRIRVEVREPVETRSSWVRFSVTCEQATPTGGAASPGGPTTPRS